MRIDPGHRAVIDAARIDAHPLGVATFEPPPRAYFRPNDPPFRIYRPARRNARLIGLGADAVFELPFNSDMAGMTDEEFCRRVLHEGLGVAHVAVGFDFRFGRGRMGDAARLSSLGRSLGFDVTIVEKVEGPDAAKASSTGIREALIAGDPQKAAAMLGHAWIADGTVERGEQRGRTIGFPTANLGLGDFLHPALGVYAVLAGRDPGVEHGGETQWLAGVANLGRRPTVAGEGIRLEVHLFDFTGDLYGEMLRVRLIDFIRPEKKFDGLEALRAQIALDCSRAREILAETAIS